MEQLSTGPWRLADQRTAIKISLLYLVLGALWIAFSDYAVSLLVADAGLIVLVSVTKGWFYIGLTALLLYLLIRRDLRVIHRSQETLRASEERYRLLFQHLTDGVIITDLERRIIDWNPAAERMFGYSKAEAVGQPTSLIHPDGESDQINARINSGVSRDGRWEGEVDYLRKDGRRGVCATTIIPLLDEQAQPLVRVGINRDLTEQKRLEAQLHQAQKMEAIGQLAGGIAHDFNNILTVTIGYCELLLESHLAEASPARADVEQIWHAGKRAAALTRHLLAFSRQQVLQPVALNLNEAVTGIEKILQRLIGADIALMVVLEEELGWVKADPTQLEQVIINLAVNARDAMPRGGRLTLETANVELTEEMAGRDIEAKQGLYALLTVTDTGHGMDQETLARIFEPFFTTKPRDQGTGLGLATVYGIVKQSGGFIKVYSEPGWGTTFKLYLPQTHRVEARPAAAPAPISTWRGSETILLVEDEAAVRRLVHDMLVEQGYGVIAVGRGDEALCRCLEEQGEIDLLLTDLILPDMTGIELARGMVNIYAGLKVLYMSGYAERAVTQRGLLELGDQFLSKPFSLNRLVRQVRETLDRVPELAA